MPLDPNSRAGLGLEVQPVVAESGKRALRLTGLAPGGPAAMAGLREGDVIVAVAGEAVTSADQLGVLTDHEARGEHVEVTCERGGASANATIKLAEAP